MRMSRLVCCISVAHLILLTLLLASSYARQVGLAWEAPTTNADGTPLTDLAGYYIYYWQDAWEMRQRADAGLQTSYTVTGLTDGATYHFAVTAYDTANNESGFSNQVSVPPDSDGDGLSDVDEEQVYGTDPLLADSDGDGLADGAEVTFWAADWSADADGDGRRNVLDPDADNDGVLDGAEVDAGTDPTDPTSHPALPAAPLVAGEVSADQTWQWVAVPQAFAAPVVVVAGLNVHGGDPVIARLRQVTATGFELRVQEWIDTDGQPPAATVGYVVVERGIHVLDDGTLLQAEQLDTAQTTWSTVSFPTPFDTTPVVVTGLTTTADPEPVTVRVQGVGATAMQVRLQEAENADQQHGAETLTYVAWEAGQGQVAGLTYEVGWAQMGQRWTSLAFATAFAEAPVVLAGMQTATGVDTATVQWQAKDATGMAARIAEEQTSDSETKHTGETVGYLALSPTGP